MVGPPEPTAKSGCGSAVPFGAAKELNIAAPPLGRNPRRLHYQTSLILESNCPLGEDYCGLTIKRTTMRRMMQDTVESAFT